MIIIKKAANINWMLPMSSIDLKKALNAMLVAIDREGADVELNLVDDAEIAELNQSFLGCTGPTNILSFPADETGKGPKLGWMALSLDTLRREALLYGQDAEEHTLRLVAHGLLHLAGYDHGEEMFALTDIAMEAGLETLRAG